MGQTVASQKGTPTRLGERDVFPVALSNLELNSILGFDLYLERMQNGNKTYLLYRQQNTAFTDNVSRKLMSNGIEMLYAPNDARALYEAHCGVTPVSDLQDGEQEDPSKESKDLLSKDPQRLYQDIAPVVQPTYRYGLMQDSVEQVQQILDRQPNVRSDTSKTRDDILALQKDQALYQHSAHVAVLGVALARTIGVKNREILQGIALGGFLHDIGMLRIPKDIRMKEELLSDAEFSLLQQHPVYGMEIVDNTPSIHWQARKVVAQHHEKCDGSGYPSGLRKDKLHAPSRIVTVVEIYDALTTPRPYGKVYPPKNALELMLQTMRTELDMNFVAGLIQLVGTLRASSGEAQKEVV